MSKGNIHPILNSAARTASGNADMGTFFARADEVQIYINVTAVSGTSPTMTVTYQISPDDGVTWFDKQAGSAISAVGKQLITVTAGVGGRARLSYVIGGTTPSFTFAAWAEGRTIEG